MICPKCRTENQSESKFCRECATPLPASQVTLTRPLETPAGELARGTVFAGRYEIIEELGAGGMGRVYRVFDKKVEEEIALKLIRPEIAAEKRTVERFRNEIKATRKITHKNICRTHDLGEEGKSLFITMEYVRGEDLKGLIRKTRALAPGTAVVIARQLAWGLGEAHRLGVVHRDLKPGNVMIDRDGNAKIMDFGIARSLAGGGTTAEGAIIGTPEYMSPEQVEGKPADRRSDIYALGVILFEMVTGRPPFEGETAFIVANKHRSETAPDPRTVNPQLPDALSRLILRCLEKEREKRYQTTEELLADFETIEAALPAPERAPAHRPSTGPKPLTSKTITVKIIPRKLVVPVAALVLLAAAIILWRPWETKKTAGLPSGISTLAVLNFENTSADIKLDAWQTAIALLLTTDLSQSKYLSVLSYDTVQSVVKNLGFQDIAGFSSDDLGRIARAGRVTFTATGGIMRAGERIIIILSVKDHQSGKVQSAKFECNAESEVPSLVDKMTVRIKELLGFSRSQISGDLDALTVEITTASPEAFKLYNDGRRQHMAGNPERAAELMLSAVEKDPEFALAYRGLAAALQEAGRGTEAYPFIRKAFELSGKASPKERFWIQSDYFSRSEATYDKAVDSCLNWLKLYPEDSHAMLRSGMSYITIEDYAMAAKLLDSSIQKGDVNPYSYFYLSIALSLSGVPEEGRRAAQRGLSILPENPIIEEALFDSYVSRGTYSEAEAMLEKLAIKKAGPAIELKAADLFILQGKFAEAAAILSTKDPKLPAIGLIVPSLRYSYGQRLTLLALTQGKFRQATDLAREPGDHLMMAYLGYREQDFETALNEAQKALEDAREVESFSGQAWALQTKGQIELAMGTEDAARRTAEELEACVNRSPIKNHVRHYLFLAGMIETHVGQHAAAVERLKKAISLLPGESRLMESWWHSVFFDGLGQASFRAGDFVRAEEAYRKIQTLALARLGFGDIAARSYYWLGRISEASNKKSDAVLSYRKFLDLWKDADPGLPEVEDAKKRLAAL